MFYKLLKNLRSRFLRFRRRHSMHAMRFSPKGRLFLISGFGCAAVAIVLVCIFARTDKTQASIDGTKISLPAESLPSATPEGVIDIKSYITPSPTPEPTPTPDPTLERGMEDERVTELQIRLMELGYLDLDDPTQYYGPATEYAVMLFQRQHNLQQDGIAGINTLNLIYSDSAKKYTLLEGTKGTDVDAFQKQLVDLGYLSKATGYYGTETIEAVKAFQKQNGLHVDGKAGEQTFSLIYSPDAKPSPSKIQAARTRAKIKTMLEVAAAQLGKPYVLGATGPKSFDCSGLVYYCLKQAGSNRGRYNAQGYSKVTDWEKITDIDNLEKGDLLFFYNNERTKIGHVGIYVGGGKMIDASSSNGKVVKRDCRTSYWRSHFYCARRPW